MQPDENQEAGKPEAGHNEPSVVEEATSRMWLTLSIVLMFVVFLALDVLLPQDWGRSGAIFLILLNIVVAQLTLICVWGTLVEGTFWVRIPWTLLLLVISWAALVYGRYLEQNYTVQPREVLEIGMFWFFGFVASYVPLKIAAWLFGWRITQAQSLQPNPNSKRYAIRDMMIGTAILAVVLAIGRALLPGEFPIWAAIFQSEVFRQFESMFVLTVFSVVSLIVKLPCIWVTLATARTELVSRCAIWILLSGLLGLGEFILLTFFLGTPGPDAVEVGACLVLGHAAMAAAMIGVLYVLRCHGYGITRIRKHPKLQNQ